MAQKKLLDVWLQEINTVYREVPFSVVTDWLQEGRLLGDDRVRLSGTEKWARLGKVPAFQPYLPRPEPFRAEDQAEALEPVELGLDWKNPGEIEDEDVDMIPLIDISLVLLIFFMMTAVTSGGFISLIQTPGAKHQLAAITQDMYWVGVDIRDPKGVIDKDASDNPIPWYSFGKENSQLHPPVRDPAEIVQAFEQALGPAAGEVRIRIRADRSLPIEIVKGITLDLQGLENRLNRGKTDRVTFAISGEVSEPQGK